jgi:xanthine dehydrogenase YagS FAD-binding subunit
MHPFEYARPATPAQAVQLLAALPGKAALLAGGSDLLALMKDGVETPERLVSLKAVRELRGLRYAPETGFRFGALVTVAELASDPALRWELPALSDAAARVAGPQIRNVATVGGNLCQRPRCWYFRNGFGLLPMHGGKSMVVEGDNRYHSILGNDGPAAFVSPSTLAPLLIALDAQVVLLGPEGERREALEQLYRIPVAAGEREHDLKPGELVTEVTLGPAAGRRIASYEVRQRETLDWPLATASVALEMDGPLVKRARVVLGQVAPLPWVAVDAQRFLEGKAIDPGVIREAAQAALHGAKALSRNRYKIQLAEVAVRRALRAAVGREEK